MLFHSSEAILYCQDMLNKIALLTRITHVCFLILECVACHVCNKKGIVLFQSLNAF